MHAGFCTCAHIYRGGGPYLGDFGQSDMSVEAAGMERALTAVAHLHYIECMITSRHQIGLSWMPLIQSEPIL